MARHHSPGARIGSSTGVARFVFCCGSLSFFYSGTAGDNQTRTDPLQLTHPGHPCPSVLPCRHLFLSLFVILSFLLPALLFVSLFLSLIRPLFLFQHLPCSLCGFPALSCPCCARDVLPLPIFTCPRLLAPHRGGRAAAGPLLPIPAQGEPQQGHP